MQNPMHHLGIIGQSESVIAELLKLEHAVTELAAQHYKVMWNDIIKLVF